MLIALLPEHQQRGYGAAVLVTLRDAWIDRLGNETCVATVWPQNAAAIALLERHGFVRVDAYRDIQGQDHLVYSFRRP